MLLVNNKKVLYYTQMKVMAINLVRHSISTSVVEHSISTKDVLPVSINLCRIFYAFKGMN